MANATSSPEAVMANVSFSSTTTTQAPFVEYQESMAVAKGLMTVVYILVFLVGTPGNIWIIYKLFKAKLWSTSSVQMTVSQRSRIYIFALACSDMVLLLTLPPTASYNFYGTWIFGSVACYTIRSIEIFAKLFSVVLLTVMSLERYIIVCTRFRQLFRAWMSLVPLLVGTIFGVIVPTVFHFLYLQHFSIGEDIVADSGVELSNPNVLMEETWVCLPMMENNLFNTFAQYTFLVGFIVPFVIMTICYILLVVHVKGKYNIRKAHSGPAAKVAKEPRYMGEVRRSVWRIAVFHFVCWAPFWGFTMLPHYIAQITSDSQQTEKANEEEMGMEVESLLFVYCRLVSNCLPYINAAGNWVLYALLNVDVRKHIHSKPNKKKRKFNIGLKFKTTTSSV